MMETRSLTARHSADNLTVTIPYNSVSHDLGGWTEKISDRAFSRTLRDNTNEVLALWSHDATKPIARRSNGTLELSSDESALTARIKPDATSWGSDARTSIESGTVTGASFGFNVREDAWARVNGNWQRTLLDVDLVEISPTVSGAYPKATATAG